jgi:hypothetical protein
MATIDASKASTYTSLNANFKELYSDKIKDLVPSVNKFLNMVKFSKGDKQLGLSFNEPVIIGLEGGVTYGGSEGEAFALNQIVSFPMKNATIKGYEIVLRSAISVGAASRAVSSKASFERGTKLLVGNMIKSIHHRLECAMLYGQKGLAIVASVSGVGNVNLNIEAEEWAAGIWLGMTGHEIDIFNASLSTLRDTVKIVSVDIENKRLVTDTDLTAAGVVATDRVFFAGAVLAGVSPEYKEQLGLHRIAEIKATLFGINNSNEPLFQGNTVDVGTNFSGGEAVLSFAKVESAIASMVDKGLAEEEVTLLCSNRSWSNLLTELSAKRSYDSSYSSAKLEQGSKSIMFHSQNGMIKVMASSYIKAGYAYAFCEKELVRIGSTDVTFDPPGYEGEFFKLLENANGYEMRCYSDQALFTTRPSAITILQYIKD